MTPITLQAAQKVAALFTNNSAIETEVNSIAAGSPYTVPVIPASQVYLTSTSIDMADVQQQLAYPRISVSAAVWSINTAKNFGRFPERWGSRWRLRRRPI